MMQLKAWICCKCGKKVTPGKEKTLQLIDRNDFTANYEGDVLSISPKRLWEYCLCPECFDEFNKSTSHPYKPVEEEKDGAERCWKCGKVLTPENQSSIEYLSNPPKHTCKECEKM